MFKRMLLMLLCVAVAIGAIAYAKVRQIQAAIAMGKSFAPPPTAVTTVTVRKQAWAPSINTIGSIKALQAVTLSTDLAGIVSEILFESGQSVKKGDVLLRLQSDQERAQLQAAEARRDLAQIELNRKQALQSKSTLASSEVDAAESELRQAIASVENARALIARKQIIAPFDGVLGLRQASLGQFLNPGTPVVTMHSVDPVLVQFTLPQHQLPFAQKGQPVRILAPANAPGLWNGTITALDSQLNDASRAITIEASIPNPGANLRHGMFVNVELPLKTENDALVVPSSAVNYAPYGDSLYVIKTAKDPEGKESKIAEQKFIKLGEARGDQIRVLSGIEEGDEIVTSGVFKLRPGAPVLINNSVQPPSEAAPKPPNT